MFKKCFTFWKNKIQKILFKKNSSFTTLDFFKKNK